MRDANRRPFHRSGRWRLLCLATAAAVSAVMFGCGARSGIELLESTPVSTGGAKMSIDPALPAQGGAPAVGAPGSSSAGASTCQSITVSIADLRPEITLMVDQSLSMRFGFPTRTSPTSRWSLVGQALFDPSLGVVETYQSSVRFGIAFFTAHPGACPLLSEVPAATDNYAALNALYQSLSPQGDTPTGEAMRQIVSELMAKPTAAPRSIVLVTDGNPDTCAQPQPDNGLPEAVAAVQSAHAAGIDVYVLGISDDVAAQNLQQLANAGKGKALDLVWGRDADAAQAYQANNSVGGLGAQLGEVLNRLPLCQVSLQRDVVSAEARAGHVTLDGQALDYSNDNGFDLEDSRHLAVVGQACDTLKARGKQLSVRIGCD